MASSSKYKRRWLTLVSRAWKDLLDRSILGCDVAVNLVPVGVVVSESRVNLRERKVLDFGGDLLGS